MGAGLAFILGTMIVHRQSNSLRALHGKCEFMFLFGMLMIHLAYPWKLEFHRFRRLLIRILYFGSMMTAFWKNVLIFDIYWSFRFVLNRFSIIWSESRIFADSGNGRKTSCWGSQTTATMLSDWSAHTCWFCLWNSSHGARMRCTLCWYFWQLRLLSRWFCWCWRAWMSSKLLEVWDQLITNFSKPRGIGKKIKIKMRVN